jgi:hypothetical protein
MNLSLPSKSVEKLVWVPVICKIFNASFAFDALSCQNWPFSSPNCLTLRITLIYEWCHSKVLCKTHVYGRGGGTLISILDSDTNPNEGPCYRCSEPTSAQEWDTSFEKNFT